MSGQDAIPQREFPATHWTMIGQAANADRTAGFKALESLLERYAPCMKAHLVYMKRMPPDRADDMVQGFIADKILQGDLLNRAERDRGKFRTFLMTSLERYVVSQIRKEQAARRSPGAGGHENVEELQDVIAAPSSSTSAFDLAWVREVLDAALAGVKDELIRTKREAYWRIFELRVINPILRNEPAPAYDELVKSLSFRSPMQASNALLTAKRMFQRNLRDTIAQYATDADDIDREIESLHAILAGASA